MTVYGGLSLNTGSYFGNGYTSGYSSSYSGNRVASSSNLNRISKDIASGYSQDLELIQEYIQQGNIDQAFSLYDDLLDDIKSTTSNYSYFLTDSNVETILNNAYVNATGSTLLDAVDKSSASPFLSGLSQGIPIIGWFVNGDTKAEATSKLAGTNVNWKDKVAEYAGAAASGAATGAIIGNFIPIPCIGAGIGALVGAAVGCLSTFIKDVF